MSRGLVSIETQVLAELLVQVQDGGRPAAAFLLRPTWTGQQREFRAREPRRELERRFNQTYLAALAGTAEPVKTGRSAFPVTSLFPEPRPGDGSNPPVDP